MKKLNDIFPVVTLFYPKNSEVWDHAGALGTCSHEHLKCVLT